MKAIKVIITKFISNEQPGFVECEFRDIWNDVHIVREKVPIITDKILNEKSKFPTDGIIACEILKTWTDNLNRTITTVDTEKPWDIETIKGQTKFELLKEQLIELNR